jgi:hypothetical protein
MINERCGDRDNKEEECTGNPSYCRFEEDIFPVLTGSLFP